MKKYLDDIFLVAGAACINGATFLLSPIAGLYALGISFLIIAVLFAIKPPKRK